MKILSYLNISNVDDIESDSGYIFNYTLAKAFSKLNCDYRIILPYVIKDCSSRFCESGKYFVDMGCTKYEARYHFEWEKVLSIIINFQPDVIFLNQVEFTATFRVLLDVNGLKNVKIFTYCHYPAIHLASNDEAIIDYTLDDNNIGGNIVFNILSAVNIADVFAIQSDFAKNLLLSFARKHNFQLDKEIHIIEPAYDENLYLPINRENNGNKVLYNHRLYDSYGTSDLIKLISENSEIEFVITDPMSNRRKERSVYNNSPQINREILLSYSNVTVIDGGNRSEYIKAIDTCKIAIAPHRKACVWSMSIIDCYCRNIPVIGPAMAVFPEMIPISLLYNNYEEELCLINKLLTDHLFFGKSLEQSRKLLTTISPEMTARKMIKLISLL